MDGGRKSGALLELCKDFNCKGEFKFCSCDVIDLKVLINYVS